MERDFYGKAHYVFAADNEAEDVDKEAIGEVHADEGNTDRASTD